MVQNVSTGPAVDYEQAETIDQLLRGREATEIISPPTRAPTDQLGRYPVTGQLGVGGMGQILQVRDENLGREMAAKVIKGRDDPQVLDKFIREARVTGQLEHPNIVPTYELGLTPDKRVYFTMKRVQGQDLAALLAAERETEGAMLQGEQGARRTSRRLVADLALFRRRSLARMLQIFLKVCDAMSFAHDKGVIHRDLKPANIMVGQFGEVQVMDWGLARQVGQPDPVAAGCTLDLGGGPVAELTQRRGGDNEPLRTLDGTVVGTPHFMPPEQARGEVGRVDRRADVYALGAILYQMLTLQLPFEGDSAWEVLRQVIEGKLIPPSERAPEREVPFELEAVVRKAMSPRARDRYDTVERLQREIESYLEGRLLQAADYSTWQVLKKWAARHKAAVVAAAGIFLTVIAAFAGISWQWRKAVRAKEAETAEKRKVERALAQLQREKTRSAKLGREKGQEQQKRRATDLVRKAMELYTRKGDRKQIDELLAEAERMHPDHAGLLRLRGRMELDQKEPDWAKAKELLDRALRQDPKDYVTHFLLYRWYDQQRLMNTAGAQAHVHAAARYGTRDSAIGLWGLGRREYYKAQRLSGSDRTKAIGLARDFCSKALGMRPDFLWAFLVRGGCYQMLECWKEALADFDAVVALIPGSGLGYYNRGDTYKAMKKYGKALTDLDKAISIDPRFAQAHVNRGLVYKALKRYDKALADLDTALRLNPGDAQTYHNRGLVYASMKRYDKALADYTAALRINPGDAETRSNRGLVYASMKRYDKAMADYDTAIRLNPSYATVHVNRGYLYLALRRYDKALADYGKAIRIDPECAVAYYYRGNLYRALKQYDKALADYDTAVQLDPRMVGAYGNRGTVHVRLRRLDKALADFDATIRLAPRDAGPHHNRGITYAMMKRYDQALADYNTAIRLDPSHVDAYRSRGTLYQAMKRYDKALADLDAVVRLIPHDATAYYNRARLHHTKKRYDQALADYTAAIRITPSYAIAYISRGILRREMKQWDKALEDYDNAIRIDPQQALAYVNRGRIYANQKRYRLAIADWELALPLVRGTALEKRLIGYIRVARSKLK